jgi:hypothetical protein
MALFTEDQINNLAPDPASLKAGKGLVNISKWKNLGFNERGIWGECQGSGSNPYKCQIDLNDIVTKCSCPSRKFPCKHAIGLMFLLVQKEDSFTSPEPDWVNEWLSNRAEKKQKKEEKKEVVKEVDPEKKAKTESKRLDLINQGIDELELWLKDLVKRGFESIKGEKYRFFDSIAARMTDYKASGISIRLKELGSLFAYDKNFDLIIEKLGLLGLIIKSFRNLDKLPEPIQADIKTIIGFTINNNDLLNLESVNDKWFIVGSFYSEEENLRVRKTYLYGIKNKKFALILEFAYGTQPFVNNDLLTGLLFEGEIVYYPSNLPIRAIIKNKNFIKEDINISELGINFEELYKYYSDCLSKNPFIDKIPTFIKASPFLKDDNFFLIDENKNYIPISKEFNKNWELINSCSGNESLIFGEWDNKSFLPSEVINIYTSEV